jgi:Tfp pilus assembly protein PilF
MTTSKHIFEDAQHLLIEGKVKESIDTFTKAIEGGENADIIFLSRGVAYLRNHETNKAIHDFSEVVKRDDHNVRAHFYRGIAYLTMEDYKDAITDFDRTIELEPENGAAFFARGTAYAHIGDDDLATKNIKTAISFSEASIYGLQETIGLWRTQFDKTLSIMSGRKRPLGMSLTEDEVSKLKKWIKEEYRNETFH